MMLFEALTNVCSVGKLSENNERKSNKYNLAMWLVNFVSSAILDFYANIQNDKEHKQNACTNKAQYKCFATINLQQPVVSAIPQFQNISM